MKGKGGCGMAKPSKNAVPVMAIAITAKPKKGGRKPAARAKAIGRKA